MQEKKFTDRVSDILELENTVRQQAQRIDELEKFTQSQDKVIFHLGVQIDGCMARLSKLEADEFE